MNILPFLTKFRRSPKLASTILDSFIVSVLTLIPPQCAPLPPLSFTPNSITVILSTATYISLRLPASNWFRTLSDVKAPKSCHITPILRSLYWLKIIKRIEYKLLSLTYKVLTTTQPPYLHHLISVQPPRSTRSLSQVTLAGPPTSSSLLVIAPFGTSHVVSGINFLVLSVNLIPAPLSLSCLFMLLPHLLTLSTHHSHHP